MNWEDVLGGETGLRGWWGGGGGGAGGHQLGGCAGETKLKVERR